MQDRTRVRYYGPDAGSVAARWSDADRPFALEGVAVSAGVVPNVEDVDGLVYRDGSGGDPVRFVEQVRERADRIPVVVFAAGDRANEALAAGVSHYVGVDGDFDPVAALADLAPVVDRYRRRKRERTMLDSLLEHIPLSVYFKDRRSRHVRVSDEMPESADAPYIENAEGKRHHVPADVRGKTDFDLYPPEHAANAVADDQQVIEDEETVQHRIEHSRGDRIDGVYVATSKAPWYDAAGDVVGVVGVTMDISERKRYELELERQNERLERFAHVVSHDLRNPLEVASGRLELARDRGDPGDFAAIERAIQRMDALIDDLLALAHQGKTVDDPQEVDLAAVAADAWAVVDAADCALDVTTTAAVSADPGRLQQLFENLYRNAMEHACADGGEVTITVGDYEGGFFVADDGPGIPDDERAAVFESGYTTGSGTGLGLSIVRSIATAHGWSVAATESAAGGARFEFTDVDRVD